MCELRSSPAGHPGYRYVAQEMAKQVSMVLPQFERFFKFVDYDGYALGRLGQEINTDQKRQEVTYEMTGTMIGGMLLIAGSCIGAGMLALPIMTGMAGFFPSLVMFLIAWGFMTVTGLLMVEVNSTFPGRVNIVSMAERAFGPVGRIVSWVLYLFLFYSLLVAYISGSGSLSSTYLHIPKWVGASIFTIILGGLCLSRHKDRRLLEPIFHVREDLDVLRHDIS